MSQSLDFESLLRKAVNDRKKVAPGAGTDLTELASEANNAIMAFTKNAATLRLEEIGSNDSGSPTFQLVLREVGGDGPPSDFGVYRLSSAGYPIRRWYSRENWLARPKRADVKLMDRDELVNNFKYLVSNPKSRLVALISFFDR